MKLRAPKGHNSTAQSTPGDGDEVYAGQPAKRGPDRADLRPSAGFGGSAPASGSQGVARAVAARRPFGTPQSPRGAQPANNRCPPGGELENACSRQDGA